VMWPNFVFQPDYDEIKLQKISYDVIVIMSTKNVTKITSQYFFILGPPPIKISGQAIMRVGVEPRSRDRDHTVAVKTAL